MDVESDEGLQKSLALLKLVAQGEEDVRRGRTRKNEAVFNRIARKHGLKLGHGRPRA